MTQSREFLGSEPIGKLLLRLALPTAAAQLVNMLYNIVDRIYIGHMPGDGALALTGIGVCFPLILFVSAFAVLVCAGGAPRASISMGQGNAKKAEQTLGNCFALLVMISAACTMVLLLFSRDLLLAFGASENTIDYAASYMRVYAIGTLFVQLTLGMNMFITAQGSAKTAMTSVMIGAVMNIMLDPLFIFVLDMGVQGAALATVLSQGASCVWILSFLCGKRTFLRIRRENLVLRAKIILPCIALGLANFVMQSSECILSICFNSSLLKYGGDIAVGAMTIIISVMQFGLMPLQAAGQGAQPIISYNYGARNADRVKAAYFLLLKINMVYSFILWSAIMLFPQTFVSMFTSSQELIDFTRKALRIYAAAQCIFGLQMACQIAFVAIGCAKSSITVAVMRKFILLIPLIYLLPAILPGSKTTAVYLAEPVADTLSVLFTAVLFSFQFRRALRDIQQ